MGMKYTYSPLHTDLFFRTNVLVSSPSTAPTSSGSLYFGLGTSSGSIANATVGVPFVGDGFHTVSGSLGLADLGLTVYQDYPIFLEAELTSLSGSSVTLSGRYIAAVADNNQFAGSGSAGNVYVNSGGEASTDPIGYLYYRKGGDDEGAWIRYNPTGGIESNHTFQAPTLIKATDGIVYAEGTPGYVAADNDIYLNFNAGAGGGDADSAVYFYDGGTVSGQWFKWDDSEDHFTVSAPLFVDVSGSLFKTLTVTDEMTVGSEIDMRSNKIVNMSAPTVDQDAATKKYVDDMTGGSVGTLQQVTDNGATTTNNVEVLNLRANSNVYVNFDGTNSDSYVYFADDSSPTGVSLKWDDNPGVFQFSEALSMAANKIVDAADPSNSQDVVTLNYLEGVISGSSSGGSPLTTKGDLYTYDTDNARLPVGTDDYLLKPDSNESTGLKWVEDPSGSAALGTPTDGVYSDGLLAFTPATQINDAVDDLNEVLSYLAPASPDALSGTLTDNITTYSGKISVNAFDLIDYSAGDTAVVSYDAALTLTAPNSTKFDEADLGTLDCYLDESLEESFDLAGAFSEAERATTQSYPPSGSYHDYVYILTCGWYNDFPMWQRATARLQIGATHGNSDLVGGEHKFKMVHGSDETNETQLYYDPESGAPSNVETPTIVEVYAPVHKYLSGLAYYTTDTTFHTSGSIDKLFEYTYHPTSQVRFTLTGMNTVDMAFNDGSVDNVHSPIPHWDDVLGFEDKLLTINALNARSTNARLTVNPRRPKGFGTSAQSASENRMIDTYGTSSTDVIEYFSDENRRLPSGSYDTVPGVIQGTWPHADSLTNENAQVVLGELIYPATDWSAGYLPAQSGSTDYSGFTGNQYYWRAMYDSGTPHFEGSLDIDGIDWADLGVNVELEMTLPTETGWLDLSKAYSAGSFTGAHGDGVMTSNSQAGSTLTINWTVGSKSTANSGYMYIIRVTLKNANNPITTVEEDGW